MFLLTYYYHYYHYNGYSQFSGNGKQRRHSSPPSPPVGPPFFHLFHQEHHTSIASRLHIGKQKAARLVHVMAGIGRFVAAQST